MLSLEKKASLLRRALGRPALERWDKHELVFRCPFCSHRKPKLSVNIKTDSYNCWTCPEGKTRGRSLVGLLRGRVEQGLISEYMDSLTQLQTTQDLKPPEEVEPPTLPEEYESLSWDWSRDPTAHRFVKYLRVRGVSHEDTVFYRIGMCRSGALSGRVVFPSFDEHGQLNFYTARKISDAVRGQNYMTPKASKDIIFNDCFVDWNRPVVLVEGPFDMVTVGRNAIPLQGKMIRPDSQLFKKIVTTGVPVYLCLDQDAICDQVTVAHILHRYGVDVYNVMIEGGGDASEAGREATHKAIADAERYRDVDRVRILCG